MLERLSKSPSGRILFYGVVSEVSGSDSNQLHKEKSKACPREGLPLAEGVKEHFAQLVSDLLNNY